MAVEFRDPFCEKKSKASLAPVLMRKTDFDSKAETLPALRRCSPRRAWIRGGSVLHDPESM